MADVREKRKYYENNLSLVNEIIVEGSKKAQIKAREVLDKVEKAVRVYR